MPCTTDGETYVENVEEHGTNIARISPVKLRVVVGGIIRSITAHLDLSTSVAALESVSATPDGESQHEQDNPACFGSDCTSEARQVEEVSKDQRAEDLRRPVQHVVEGAGAGVELGQVDAVELVSVEPVGGKEHGEEEHDVRLAPESLPHAKDLGLESWVLHENDAAAISADHVLGIAKQPGEAGAND